MRRSSRSAVFATVLVASLFVLIHNGFPQGRNYSGAETIYDGQPLTITQIIRFWNARSTTSRPRGLKLETTVKSIRSRRLAFIATQDNISKLQQAGVGEEILAIVKEIAPEPRAPEPPPPKETGPLEITCAPTECTLVIEAGRTETTKGGTFSMTLLVGRHLVDINRPGYSHEQKVVEVKKGGASISVKLNPDEATMSSFGGTLFTRMLDAAGDDNIDIKGTGSWTVQKTNSPLQEWTFALRLAPSESVFAILRPPDAVYEIQCRGQSCLPPKKPTLLRGKSVKPDQAAAIDSDLKVFRRHYISSLVPLWKTGIASTFQLRAETDQAIEDRYRLRLTGPENIYDLELDRSFLPVQVSDSSKLVGGAPTVVTYLDYVHIGKLRCPKQMSIRLPEQPPRAIQVRLDGLEPAKAP
jgi:hypothetical protein